MLLGLFASEHWYVDALCNANATYSVFHAAVLSPNIAGIHGIQYNGFSYTICVQEKLCCVVWDKNNYLDLGQILEALYPLSKMHICRIIELVDFLHWADL